MLSKHLANRPSTRTCSRRGSRYSQQGQPSRIRRTDLRKKYPPWSTSLSPTRNPPRPLINTESNPLIIEISLLQPVPPRHSPTGPPGVKHSDGHYYSNPKGNRRKCQGNSFPLAPFPKMGLDCWRAFLLFIVQGRPTPPSSEKHPFFFTPHCCFPTKWSCWLVWSPRLP